MNTDKKQIAMSAPTICPLLRRYATESSSTAKLPKLKNARVLSPDAVLVAKPKPTYIRLMAAVVPIPKTINMSTKVNFAESDCEFTKYSLDS